MKDFLVMVIFPIICVCVALFIAIYSLILWSCGSYQNATGLPTKVEGGNCFIKEDGQWLTYEERKLRYITKGGEQ